MGSEVVRIRQAFRRLGERRARVQARREFVSARRQDSDRDVGLGPRDQRVLARRALERARFGAALVGGPDRGCGRCEAEEPRGGMELNPRSGQRLGESSARSPMVAAALSCA